VWILLGGLSECEELSGVKFIWDDESLRESILKPFFLTNELESFMF
jgi:hypothetical protein